MALLLTILPPGGIKIAEAATFNIASLTTPGEVIKPATQKAVLKVTFGASEASQNLTSMTVNLAPVNNSPVVFTDAAATASELADLATDANSGISLYKDDLSNGVQGTFEAQDDLVTLVASPVYAAVGDGTTDFILTPDATTTLADGDIFYVVIKSETSGNMTGGRQFTVGITAQNDIVTSGTNPTISGSGITTNPIWTDKTAPTVQSAFAWTDSATTVEIFFSEMMTSSTLECASAVACANIYTISGSIDVNSAEALGWSDSYADAVKLTLASAATNGTTTVTIAETIADRAGNTFSSPGAITLNQDFPPFPVGVNLVNGTTIDLVFDQNMDSSTTNVTARYTITTAAEDTETVDSATLQGDNKTVRIVAGSATIADGDALQINGLFNITNTDGDPAQGPNFFNIDNTAPTIAGVTVEDNAGDDYVYIRFSEGMRPDIANVTGNYVPDAGSVTAAQLLWYNPDTSPAWMTASMTDKVAKLTTPDVSAITDITVSTNLVDFAGNALGGDRVVELGGGVADAIAIASAITTTFNKGSMMMGLDGCNDSWAETGNYNNGEVDGSNPCFPLSDDANRDTIVINFTGPIDVGYLGESSDGAVIPNIGQFLEIYSSWTYGSSQSECGGGDIWTGSVCQGRSYANLDTSYGKVTDGAGTNQRLTIYLQGSTSVWNGMTVNPSGVKGLNGLTATQHATPANNVIPMPTFAEVEYIKSTRAGAAFADGDTVTLFFSADMTRTDTDDTTELGNNVKPERMFPWAQHSWGSGGSLAVAWGNYTAGTTTCTIGANNGSPDCMEITLGDSPTLAVGDEVRLMNVTSADGLPLGWGGKIDITAPTATASLNTDTDIVYITFSEEMNESDGTSGDYSDNITYDGSGGSTTAAIDTDYSSDGFTAGIKLITDMDINNCVNCWIPLKKFALKLDADPEATDSITFTKLLDEGGNVVAGAINPSSDATAPGIFKIIRNDWDNNGQLNAWDEMIIVPDGDPGTEGKQAADIDYGTITNVNTDFIIKRSGQIVTNPFGEGADYWIDQWYDPMTGEDHAGEIHVNLRQGANIQAGDELWAAEGEITDLNGNAMDHTAALKTIASIQGGEISKIVYTDNGDAGLNNTDTFVIFFNTAVDPNSLGTYEAGGTPEVANLDWGIRLEPNFEMNYNATWEEKTWGSATGDWNAAFTQLTITLAGGDATFGDTDMVTTWPLRTAEGGSFQRPGVIDLTAPILKEVYGSTFTEGSTLTFIFSEPMDATTVLAGNLGIAGGASTLGGSPSVSTSDQEGRVYEVTLGTSPTIVPGTTTFNPTAAVKDMNGVADNTVSAVGITTGFVSAPTSITAIDNDTSDTGIDGRDLRVTWTAGEGSTSYKIYLLPDFVPFNLDNHNPIAVTTAAVSCSGGTCGFTGSTAIKTDSRSTATDASIDSNKPYQPLNDWDNYNVFMIGTDGSGNSFPNKTTSTFRFTVEYNTGGDGGAPWVEGTMPFDGAKVPMNGAKINIKFNEQMDRSTVESSSNIIMEKKGTDGSWTAITSYNSYDNGEFRVAVEPAAALLASTSYRVRITTSVTDVSGTAMENEFVMRFSTKGTTDTTSPQVSAYYFGFNGTTSTSAVSRDIPVISVAFNEEMDTSTFSDTSVSLSPAVSGSTVWYDPFIRTLNYVLGGPLAQNTAYTLTVSGVYVKDVAGNTLDGDGDSTGAGTTADNYEVAFTTENSALSTSKAEITWIDAEVSRIRAGFSEPIKKTAAEKRTNWTITKTSDSSTIDLQTASVRYDDFMKELEIEGVSLEAGAAYTLNPSSSILAMNGQGIEPVATDTDSDTIRTVLSFTPWDPGAVFHSDTITNFDMGAMGGQFNGDMFAKMGDANVADDKDFKMFMPIGAWPSNRTASQTTNFHINFPTTQAIAHGGKIVLKFPASFNIASAAMATDPDGALFFFNRDINGPGGTATAGDTSDFNPMGKVQVSNVAVNNVTKLITLTLAVDDGTGCTINESTGAFNANCTDTNATSTTMPYDFLDFELSGIVNGDAAEIDWANNQGGYQIEITTKNPTGKVLEGPVKSERFDITAAGNGSISGTVYTSNGVTPVQSARVFCDGPGGHFEATTGSDGTYSFSGLPVDNSGNSWGGWYHIWVEAPKANDDVFGGQGFDVQLTSSSQTSTGNNVTLNSASNTISVTITHTGDDLDGKNVELWAGGPSGWKGKKITLDADGSTATTIKVDNGMWDFGVNSWMEMSGFGGGHMEMLFMPPKPVQKSITGNDTVTIALTAADKTISGKVVDGSGGGLANVNIYSYSPSGDGSGSGTQTATDGSYTLNVTDGTYVVGANKPGLPGMPEKTVTVAGSNVTGINFTADKPDSSISGNVTDGTDAIQYASVNAWTNDGRFISTSTDNQGAYTFFLGAGTWSLEAFAPGYGRIVVDSGVDVTDIVVGSSSTITGKNFSVAGSTYYLIKGQVKDSSNNPIANVSINADEIGWSGGRRGQFMGNGNGATTDSNGNYSIKVSANGAGTGSDATRYELHGWSSEYGDLKPNSTTPIDVSSANSTGNNFTLAATWEMTVNITNADQLEVGAIDIKEAFIDFWSPTNNTGNHRRFKDINLSGGSATPGTMKVSSGSGYEAMAHVPGIGDFACTLGGNRTFSVAANGTLTCDFGLNDASSVITLSGTVKDEGANNLANAWVNVMNTTTFAHFGTNSAANGTYTLKVPAGTYTLRADKPGYASPAEVEVTADDAARTLTMTTAGSTITGTVKKSDGVTAEPNSFVWAEEVGGSGFVGAEVDTDGTYTLAVPDGTSWNVYAQSDKGYAGNVSGSATAGSSSKDVVVDSLRPGASHVADQPKSAPMTLSSGGQVKDEDNTGVNVTIPQNAGTDNNPGQLTINETFSAPSTSTVSLFGAAKNLTMTDSSGDTVTNFQNDVEVEIVMTKAEIEDFAQANNSLEDNGLTEIQYLENMYWDGSTGTWQSLPTTVTVEVKNDTADDWTQVDFSTFFDNITGEESNVANGGGEKKDFYDNFKIKLASTTDHFTVFGTKVNSDGDGPSTPTGLTANPTNGSVSLDWVGNSEPDLLEYEIYRSTAEGFSCSDSTQINTGSVTTSSYTDSSPAANTSYTYYYKITAVDDSWNESACTSAATATYTYTANVSSGGGGGGGGGGNYRPSTITSTTLPKTQSSREMTSLRPVKLPDTGVITRPVKLQNVYGSQTVILPKGAIVTDEKGTPFTGVISVPEKLVVPNIPDTPQGFSYVEGMTVGAMDGTPLKFSEPFKVSIPVGARNNAVIKQLQVYSFDTERGHFVLAGDGGTFNTFNKTMEVEVDHMSMFIVLNTNGNVMPIYEDEPEELTPEVGAEEEVMTYTANPVIPEVLIQPVPAFHDTRGHWATGYIDELRKRGVVSGKQKDIYEPNSDLTRAELTKIALNAFSIPIEKNVAEKPFADVDLDSWYVNYIDTAKKYNIIKGYDDGTFAPNEPISRVEALKVILETSNINILNTEQMNFVDTMTGSWYEKYVTFAHGNGLIDGFHGAMFKPESAINRAEIARVVAKLWQIME
ncbi:carboxypeptidase regulatory-like domain-containing protein [Candidatus Gracilibacteria bacterium]|nr:carboxypeptidase regulatory-like domain-containing protein [Candidatus Gracilibacteria bacterium]